MTKDTEKPQPMGRFFFFRDVCLGFVLAVSRCQFDLLYVGLPAITTIS